MQRPPNQPLPGQLWLQDPVLQNSQQPVGSTAAAAGRSSRKRNEAPEVTPRDSLRIDGPAAGGHIEIKPMEEEAQQQQQHHHHHHHHHQQPANPPAVGRLKVKLKGKLHTSVPGHAAAAEHTHHPPRDAVLPQSAASSERRTLPMETDELLATGQGQVLLLGSAALAATDGQHAAEQRWQQQQQQRVGYSKQGFMPSQGIGKQQQQQQLSKPPLPGKGRITLKGSAKASAAAAAKNDHTAEQVILGNLQQLPCSSQPGVAAALQLQSAFSAAARRGAVAAAAANSVRMPGRLPVVAEKPNGGQAGGMGIQAVVDPVAATINEMGSNTGIHRHGASSTSNKLLLAQAAPMETDAAGAAASHHWQQQMQPTAAEQQLLMLPPHKNAGLGGLLSVEQQQQQSLAAKLASFAAAAGKKLKIKLKPAAEMDPTAPKPQPLRQQNTAMQQPSKKERTNSSAKQPAVAQLQFAPSATAAAAALFSPREADRSGTAGSRGVTAHTKSSSVAERNLEQAAVSHRDGHTAAGSSAMRVDNSSHPERLAASGSGSGSGSSSRPAMREAESQQQLPGMPAAAAMDVDGRAGVKQKVAIAAGAGEQRQHQNGMLKPSTTQQAVGSGRKQQQQQLRQPGAAAHITRGTSQQHELLPVLLPMQLHMQQMLHLPERQSQASPAILPLKPWRYDTDNNVALQHLKLYATVSTITSGSLKKQDSHVSSFKITELERWVAEFRQPILSGQLVDPYVDASEGRQQLFDRACKVSRNFDLQIAVTGIIREQPVPGQQPVVYVRAFVFNKRHWLSQEELAAVQGDNSSPFGQRALSKAKDTALYTVLVKLKRQAPLQLHEEAVDEMYAMDWPLVAELHVQIISFVRYYLRYEPNADWGEDLRKLRYRSASINPAAEVRYSVGTSSYVLARQKLYADLLEQKQRQQQQPGGQAAGAAGAAAAAGLLPAAPEDRGPAGAAAAAAAQDQEPSWAAAVIAKYFGAVAGADKQALARLAQGARQLERSGVSVEAMFAEAQQLAEQRQRVLVIQNPTLITNNHNNRPMVFQKAFLLPAGHALTADELQQAKIPPKSGEPLPEANQKAENVAAVCVVMTFRRQAKLSAAEAANPKAACEEMKPEALQEVKLQLVAAIKWHLSSTEGVEWGPLLQQVQPVEVPAKQVTRVLIKHTGISAIVNKGLKM